MASIHSYRGRRGTTYRVFWRTSDGLQRTQTFASKTEAREWRATVERLEAAGQAPDPARGDISLEVWAGQVLQTLHLKPKTAETYASLLRSRIIPTFGSQPIGSISRAQVRDWVSEMAGEVSAKRTRNAHGLLSRLLNEAVLEGRLLTNPAAGVALPKAVSADVVPWTAEELLAVAAEAGRYQGLIIWLGLMGTRWAETIGLEPYKIRDGVVRIDSTLSEVNGRFHRVTTKTSVIRMLPIPTLVQQHISLSEEGLVFTTTYGNPIRSAAFRSRVYRPAIERAGVRPLHIHGLRHTCASLLASNGATPKVIQAWLGHQDFRTTMGIYTHAFSSDVADAAKRFDALLVRQGLS